MPDVHQPTPSHPHTRNTRAPATGHRRKKAYLAAKKSLPAWNSANPQQCEAEIKALVAAEACLPVATVQIAPERRHYIAPDRQAVPTVAEWALISLGQKGQWLFGHCDGGSKWSLERRATTANCDAAHRGTALEVERSDGWLKCHHLTTPHNTMAPPPKLCGGSQQRNLSKLFSY